MKLRRFKALVNPTVSGCVQLALLLTILLSSILVLGCVHRQQIDPYQSLMNQGILALSTDNAFAGANIFLAEELEQSQYLYEFFKGRGAPTAIELNRTRGGAPRMIMYYPSEKQSYVASLVKRPAFHEWIVRGPYAMLRRDFRELQGITTSIKGTPLFEIDRRPYRFKELLVVVATPHPTPAKHSKPRVTKKPAVSKATPKPSEVVATAPVAAVAPTATPAPASKEFHKLNSDQKALMIAKGYAERADNGDVVHTVKRPEETLGDIARWYTDLDSNSQAIAQANNIADAQAVLPAGSKVRVPVNLVKQDKAMPTTYASGKVQREKPEDLPKSITKPEAASLPAAVSSLTVGSTTDKHSDQKHSANTHSEKSSHSNQHSDQHSNQHSNQHSDSHGSSHSEKHSEKDKHSEKHTDAQPAKHDSGHH